MTKRELMATISEVKLIIANVMATHIEDERRVSENTHGLFSKISDDISGLNKITSLNSQMLNNHMIDENRMLKVMIGVFVTVVTLFIGWATWLTISNIQNGKENAVQNNDIKTLYDTIDRIPSQTAQETAKLLEHTYDFTK